MTFQRQSRQSFPTGTIILMAAIVLGFSFFIAKSLKKATPEPPRKQIEEQDTLNQTGSRYGPPACKALL